MKKKYSVPIIIKDLKWNYGDRNVLKNINLEFERNKFYTIIGPNGSGKTTLLKNISKILFPKKECVYINEIDLITMKNKTLAQNISYVPQNTMIDFEFSVMDVVLMGRNPYMGRFQSEREEDIEIAKKAMQMTNTWKLREKNINELSGGERQRVIVARALTQDTDIIILDEPISNLDIHHQIELLDTVKFLKKDITVIAVLHDLNLAAKYSDYLILTNNGEIVQKGSPREVLTKENIEKVYSIKVNMIEDPVTGSPHIIPMSTYFNR
ncbi:ABC transporter ATP-binding protein [Clostridium ganghwense]|uniref:ABC transporter ATP-binding protein n=1 Tax=Clostridium ganghwense TaxID=312089 RepID=A0ABT4CMJ2_9CLOT|nr:ABC transporter ATP-binding protein [Clostridium ganghwense]MCY6369643.1 ABC transporter ATP-binding protein [Clostridium ganghwense]